MFARRDYGKDQAGLCVNLYFAADCIGRLDDVLDNRPWPLFRAVVRLQLRISHPKNNEKECS